MKFVSVEKSGEVKAIARSMASVDGMCIVRSMGEAPMRPHGRSRRHVLFLVPVGQTVPGWWEDTDTVFSGL